MKALVCEAEFSPRPGYVPTVHEKRWKKARNANLVWQKPKVSLKEVSEPKIGPRDVLLKVKACGICGTDLHMRETDKDGYMIFPGWTRFPLVLGHECSGVVVDKGELVTELEIGDMVASEQMLWCGECDPCRGGYVAQCRNMEELGVTLPGAIAEYTVVKAMHCWEINALAEHFGGDEDKVFPVAAMVEPTSGAYKSIYWEAGGFDPGAHVVIYGAGPIGLAAIAICKAGGAATVTCFETIPERRELAKMMGATHVIDPTQVSIADEVKKITRGDGADFQLEAAGVSDKLMPHIEQAMAVGGKISLFGLGPNKPELDAARIQFKGGQITGCVGHGGRYTFRNVIRLMASGVIDVLPIITHRFSLDQAMEAMDTASKRTGGKVMVCI